MMVSDDCLDNEKSMKIKSIHFCLFSIEKVVDIRTKRSCTHHVLLQLQNIISQTDLTVHLWHILLQVVLAIGDTVLSLPYQSTCHLFCIEINQMRHCHYC
jgi:hypothetical protein